MSDDEYGDELFEHLEDELRSDDEIYSDDNFEEEPVEEDVDDAGAERQPRQQTAPPRQQAAAAEDPGEDEYGEESFEDDEGADHEDHDAEHGGETLAVPASRLPFSPTDNESNHSHSHATLDSRRVSDGGPLHSPSSDVAPFSQDSMLFSGDNTLTGEGTIARIGNVLDEFTFSPSTTNVPGQAASPAGNDPRQVMRLLRIVRSLAFHAGVTGATEDDEPLTDTVNAFDKLVTANPHFLDACATRGLVKSDDGLTLSETLGEDDVCVAACLLRCSAKQLNQSGGETDEKSFDIAARCITFAVNLLKLAVHYNTPQLAVALHMATALDCNPPRGVLYTLLSSSSEEVVATANECAAAVVSSSLQCGSAAPIVQWTKQGISAAPSSNASMVFGHLLTSMANGLTTDIATELRNRTEVIEELFNDVALPALEQILALGKGGDGDNGAVCDSFRALVQALSPLISAATIQPATKLFESLAKKLCSVPMDKTAMITSLVSTLATMREALEAVEDSTFLEQFAAGHGVNLIRQLRVATDAALSTSSSLADEGASPATICSNSAKIGAAVLELISTFNEVKKRPLYQLLLTNGQAWMAIVLRVFKEASQDAFGSTQDLRREISIAVCSFAEAALSMRPGEENVPLNAAGKDVVSACVEFGSDAVRSALFDLRTEQQAKADGALSRSSRSRSHQTETSFQAALSTPHHQTQSPPPEAIVREAAGHSKAMSAAQSSVLGASKCLSTALQFMHATGGHKGNSLSGSQAPSSPLGAAASQGPVPAVLEALECSNMLATEAAEQGQRTALPSASHADLEFFEAIESASSAALAKATLAVEAVIRETSGESSEAAAAWLDVVRPAVEALLPQPVPDAKEVPTPLLSASNSLPRDAVPSQSPSLALLLAEEGGYRQEALVRVLRALAVSGSGVETHLWTKSADSSSAAIVRALATSLHTLLRFVAGSSGAALREGLAVAEPSTGQPKGPIGVFESHLAVLGVFLPPASESAESRSALVTALVVEALTSETAHSVVASESSAVLAMFLDLLCLLCECDETAAATALCTGGSGNGSAPQLFLLELWAHKDALQVTRNIQLLESIAVLIRTAVLADVEAVDAARNASIQQARSTMQNTWAHDALVRVVVDASQDAALQAFFTPPVPATPLVVQQQPQEEEKVPAPEPAAPIEEAPSAPEAATATPSTETPVENAESPPRAADVTEVPNLGVQDAAASLADALDREKGQVSSYEAALAEAEEKAEAQAAEIARLRAALAATSSNAAAAPTQQNAADTASSPARSHASIDQSAIHPADLTMPHPRSPRHDDDAPIDPESLLGQDNSPPRDVDRTAPLDVTKAARAEEPAAAVSASHPPMKDKFRERVAEASRVHDELMSLAEGSLRDNTPVMEAAEQNAEAQRTAAPTPYLQDNINPEVLREAVTDTKALRTKLFHLLGLLQRDDEDDEEKQPAASAVMSSSSDMFTQSRPLSRSGGVSFLEASESRMFGTYQQQQPASTSTSAGITKKRVKRYQSLFRLQQTGLAGAAQQLDRSCNGQMHILTPDERDDVLGEISRLEEQTKVLTAVINAIKVREEHVDSMHDFVARYERNPKHFAAALSEAILSTHLENLRLASEEVMHTIETWRKTFPPSLESHTRPFMYRGKNYVSKMQVDLQFVLNSPIGKFVVVDLNNNVRLVPRRRDKLQKVSETELRRRNFFARLSAPYGTTQLPRSAGALSEDVDLVSMQVAAEQARQENMWFRSITAEAVDVRKPDRNHRPSSASLSRRSTSQRPSTLDPQAQFSQKLPRPTSADPTRRRLEQRRPMMVRENILDKHVNVHGRADLLQRARERDRRLAVKMKQQCSSDGTASGIGSPGSLAFVDSEFIASPMALDGVTSFQASSTSSRRGSGRAASLALSAAAIAALESNRGMRKSFSMRATALPSVGATWWRVVYLIAIVKAAVNRLWQRCRRRLAATKIQRVWRRSQRVRRLGQQLAGNRFFETDFALPRVTSGTLRPNEMVAPAISITEPEDEATPKESGVASPEEVRSRRTSRAPSLYPGTFDARRRSSMMMDEGMLTRQLFLMYRQQFFAARLIQRHWRPFIRRLKYFRAVQNVMSILKIQRWFRHNRRFAVPMRREMLRRVSKTRIVKWFKHRQQVSVERTQRREWRNAIRLQRAWRCQRAKATVARLSEQRFAAITIQRRARGMFGRKHARAVRMAKTTQCYLRAILGNLAANGHRRRVQAAIQLQSGTRGMWGRRYYRQWRAICLRRSSTAASADAPQQQELEFAATRVQQLYRGYRARCAVRAAFFQQAPQWMHMLGLCSPSTTSVRHTAVAQFERELEEPLKTLCGFRKIILAKKQRQDLREKRRWGLSWYFSLMLNTHAVHKYRLECAHKGKDGFLRALKRVRARQERQRLVDEAAAAQLARRREAGAIAMQSLWRSYATRQDFNRVYEEYVFLRQVEGERRRQQNAAWMILKTFRIYMARKMRKTLAASRIQAEVLRVLRERREAERQLRLFRQQVLAAWKIQTVWRLYREAVALTHNGTKTRDHALRAADGPYRYSQAYCEAALAAPIAKPLF